MANMSYENLLAEEEAVRMQALDAFYFNEAAVNTLVAAEDKTKISAVLNMGLTWKGSPQWSTSRTARKLVSRASSPGHQPRDLLAWVLVVSGTGSRVGPTGGHASGSTYAGGSLPVGRYLEEG